VFNKTKQNDTNKTMKEILKQLAEIYNTLKARANEALTKLPQLEQAQMASELGYAMQGIKWAGERAIEGCAGLDEKLAAIETGIEEEIQKKAGELAQVQLQQMLQAGTVVNKADMDAAIEGARAQAAEAVRAEMAESAEKEQKRNVRIGELQSKHGIPAEVASAVCAEALDSEDFDSTAKAIKARVDRLAALRITSPGNVKEFVSLGVNAEGEAEFEKRVSFQESLQKDTGAPVKPPFEGGTGSSGSSGSITPICAI